MKRQQQVFCLFLILIIVLNFINEQPACYMKHLIQKARMRV